MNPDDLDKLVIETAAQYNGSAPIIKGPRTRVERLFAGGPEDSTLNSTMYYIVNWGTTYEFMFGTELLLPEGGQSTNIGERVKDPKDEIYILTFKMPSDRVGPVSLIIDLARDAVRVDIGRGGGKYGGIERAEDMEINQAIDHFFKVVYNAHGQA